MPAVDSWGFHNNIVIDGESQGDEGKAFNVITTLIGGCDLWKVISIIFEGMLGLSIAGSYPI